MHKFFGGRSELFAIHASRPRFARETFIVYLAIRIHDERSHGVSLQPIRDVRLYTLELTWLGRSNVSKSSMVERMARSIRPIFRSPSLVPASAAPNTAEFLMSLPLRRMVRCVGDPDTTSRNQAERLLLAGLDYSLQKIRRVCRRPNSRACFSQHCRPEFGRTIVLHPDRQLSPRDHEEVACSARADGYDSAKPKEFIW